MCDLGSAYNALTPAGTTPLYFAAQEGRLPVVKYLYEKGKCDLSARSNDGRKPIHAACQCGHTHIIKVTVTDSEYSLLKLHAEY